jgi:hypothetical protein
MPQHLAPTVLRDPIKANCINFADLPSKRCLGRSFKKNSRIFLARTAKRKTPLGRSGVHLI